MAGEKLDSELSLPIPDWDDIIVRWYLIMNINFLYISKYEMVMKLYIKSVVEYHDQIPISFVKNQII